MRPIHPTAVALIKQKEGCRLRSYQCEAGKWTIGYGSRRGVQPGMVITQAEAERRFQEDLREHAAHVERLVKVPLDNNQYAALVSLVFNIGPTQFATSTLLRVLNAGDYEQAADQFRVWRLVQGKVSMNLVQRREAERNLFLGRMP